jgi:hypothetical protein
MLFLSSGDSIKGKERYFDGCAEGGARKRQFFCFLFNLIKSVSGIFYAVHDVAN